MIENGNKLIRLHLIFLIAILLGSCSVLVRAESSCAQCKEELAFVWYEQGGERVHEACLPERALRSCLVCNQPLIGTYYSDGLGQYVCGKHLERLERCYSCQRFVCGESGANGRRLPDGRLLCSTCEASAVDEIDELLRLKRGVLEKLSNHGIGFKVEVPVELVDRKELLKHAPGSALHPLGATLYRSIMTRTGSYSYRDFRVMLLSGLPRAQLKEVLAHELMHVWLLANGVDQLEPREVEGACQYAAYLILKEDHSESGRFYLEQLIGSDDPIYGEGFREVAGAVELRGISDWLDKLRDKAPTSLRAARE